MRTKMVEVREGEMVGPVDWEHPDAKDMPPIWRKAESAPADFYYIDDFSKRTIHAIGMYDGWPYWKPTPAMLVSGPLGSEWKHFNSYGVRKTSIQPR